MLVEKKKVDYSFIFFDLEKTFLAAGKSFSATKNFLLQKKVLSTITTEKQRLPPIKTFFGRKTFLGDKKTFL